MPNYRRANIKGGVFFFTVVIKDRTSNLLVDEVDRFRRSYRLVSEGRPFETIAICILPDHLHALWALPEGDSDFAGRWSLIKSSFSRGLDRQPRSRSQMVKREKASGSGAIGSTPFGAMPISTGMSTTFISIP